MLNFIWEEQCLCWRTQIVLIWCIIVHFDAIGCNIMHCKNMLNPTIYMRRGAVFVFVGFNCPNLMQCRAFWWNILQYIAFQKREKRGALLKPSLYERCSVCENLELSTAQPEYIWEKQCLCWRALIVLMGHSAPRTHTKVDPSEMQYNSMKYMQHAM